MVDLINNTSISVPTTHTVIEAVVLFDYEKQQDDELSLKVGDIITDVEQVCAQHPYPYFHINLPSKRTAPTDNVRLKSDYSKWRQR